MRLRRWTRTYFVVLAAAMWLGVGLAAPLIMTFYSAEGPGDSVEASAADSFSISQPITLSAAPLIRIDRGSIAFVDGAGKVVAASGPTSSTASSGANILLFNAVISVAAAGDATRGDLGIDVSPFAAALSAGRYETLSLRRTTLLVRLGRDTPEAITDVKAEVSMRRRGQISLKGTGLLRGRSVALDAVAMLGPADKKTAGQTRVPLKFTLKGENVDASFDGRMLLNGKEIGFEGPGELSMTSGRRVARWLGAAWPSGHGLRNVVVRGQMEFSRQTLAFEKATVRMDGNEGTGVLAMRFAEPRPVLSGTLAYKSFDASVYLGGAGGAIADGPLSWSSIAAGALTVPLGLHLDADLRVSADRISLGKFDLGPSAATLALKDGRLLADFAGLKINGGEGGGQITADFTGFVPKVTVRAKLENVDMAHLTGLVVGSQQIQGRMSIVADLAGSGATLKGLVDGLAGKLAVRSQSGGRIGIDLRGLASAAKDQEVLGWPSAARTTTPYDNVDLRLVLRDGALFTETAEIRSADATWFATGVVGLLSDRIDMRLIQSGPAVGVTQGAPQFVIEFKGPLREPRIKYEAVR